MPRASSALLHFEGGNALSDFRVRKLLQALQRVNERITALSAQHVHWVRCAAPLAAPDHDKMAALLRYGDPAVPAGGDKKITGRLRRSKRFCLRSDFQPMCGITPRSFASS